MQHSKLSCNIVQIYQQRCLCCLSCCAFTLLQTQMNSLALCLLPYPRSVCPRKLPLRKLNISWHYCSFDGVLDYQYQWPVENHSVCYVCIVFSTYRGPCPLFLQHMQFQPAESPCNVHHFKLTLVHVLGKAYKELEF